MFYTLCVISWSKNEVRVNFFDTKDSTNIVILMLFFKTKLQYTDKKGWEGHSTAAFLNNQANIQQMPGYGRK